MKIAILGANSQLGKELIEQLKNARYEVLAFTRKQVDITEPTAIALMFAQNSIDCVINTGAFTQVDQCETNRSEAFFVNSIGPYYLAREAKKNNVKFIHISTDYVFDGCKKQPYVEDDQANPQTVYGKSKRLGEELVLSANEESIIIRTSWLYGHGGKNFVNTILRLIQQQPTITVVDDQWGCPTYTKDLSIAIQQLLNKPAGIYHVSNAGECSWFEFANEIADVFQKSSWIKPISTADYGSKTPRPMYSVFSHQKIQEHGIMMRHWKVALHEFLEKEGD